MALNDFTFTRVDYFEFSVMESEWNELVKNSDSNSLFMSWAWLHSWWVTWGKQLDLELYIHKILRGDQLVGILPLYSFKKKNYFFTEFQFIGNAWGRFPTVRSEYTSPILLQSESAALYQSVSLWIKQHDIFVYFIFSDCPPKSLCYPDYIIRREDVGYLLDVTGSLEDYKRSLGSGLRLKVFNREFYLKQHYAQVDFGFYNLDYESIDTFFNLLNSFHRLRWGRECFDAAALAFHKNYILNATGVKPLLGFLSVNGDVLSVSYNILVDHRLYNIQSGYYEGFDKKLALGYLHFGKLISYAFLNKDIREFDFLAGFGKNSNYKKRFLGVEVKFVTIQLFPSTIFNGLFKVLVSTKKIFLRWRSLWLHH